LSHLLKLEEKILNIEPFINSVRQNIKPFIKIGRKILNIEPFINSVRQNIKY
jgi:hypothetical protein